MVKNIHIKQILFILIIGLLMGLTACDGKATPAPAPTPLPPQFSFFSPYPNQEYTIDEDESITVNGTYQNMTEGYYVWLFLEDIFGNYYVQSPAVRFNPDGTWEGSNIRPLREIRYVVAAFVNEEGNRTLTDWVDISGFGNIAESKLKSEVAGYQEIARVPIMTPGVVLPPAISTSRPQASVPLDDFTTLNARQPDCQPFEDEQAASVLVYCTYYVNAAPDLSFISLNDGRQALKVEFDLIPHPTPNWQNWFSIRKPFAAPVDLSSFTGIRINLFVEDPANAVLRLSLADIGEDNTSDEIWWCNTRNVLNNPDGGWQLVECPFDQFVLGNVGRNNDFTFDSRQIVAYEITLISDPGASPSGTFIVDTVEAYGTGE